MIKTIDDIPNTEVGRYLSGAVGAIIGIMQGLEIEEDITPEKVLATLNEGFLEDRLVDPELPPPAVVRVDYAVMALEDRIKELKDQEYCQEYYFGLRDAIEIIKLFAEGEKEC